MAGLADELSRGVLKKRLNDYRDRSIIAANAARYWGYAFLFAKQSRANISPDELVAFRKLAAAYAQMTVSELKLNTGLHNGDLLEICHDG